MKMAMITALLLLLGVAAASAQTLQHMVAVRGECQALVIAGDSLSDNCSSSVLQMIYSDGRTGFYIGTADSERLFAFSGLEQAVPGQSTVTQQLDKVILSPKTAGQPATAVPVTGTCHYSNPYDGPMLITCSAKNQRQELYQLKFLTDGEDPEIFK